MNLDRQGDDRLADPALKSKSDGTPADSTVAITVMPPAVTWTGSPTSAPLADPTAVKTPVLKSATAPNCRLLFPVNEFVVPIVMLPCVEFEATHEVSKLTPSVASIAGSSTGQRKYGVQRPGPADSPARRGHFVRDAAWCASWAEVTAPAWDLVFVRSLVSKTGQPPSPRRIRCPQLISGVRVPDDALVDLLHVIMVDRV